MRFGALFSVLTAPFFTVAASMQMSVMPHLNMYGTPISEQEMMKKVTELANPVKQIENKDAKAVVESKSTSDIKVYTSARKKKLLNMSGQVGKNEPFRAPVYTSYWECIRGLYRQGVLGFYKGNLYRQCYLLFSGVTQVEIAFTIKKHTGYYGFLNHFIGSAIADMIFHPLHLIESRYILQNRIKAFWTYKSLYTFIIRSNYEVYNGVFAHIPKNLILAFSGFSFFSSISLSTFFAKELVVSALIYPFITVMRRVEAQAKDPGMIPQRYYNCRHCFGLMYREEGIRGFYRGFSSFCIGMTIFILTVPICSFYSTHKSPLLGFIDDDD